MNERFVNIKVDREERPDVDAIYMDAVQALTGQRRLADDRVPRRPTAGRSSAARTSRPTDRHGMPGFCRMLDAVDDVVGATGATSCSNRPSSSSPAIEASTLAGRIAAETAGRTLSPARARPGRTPAVARPFDAVDGGFGRAPKFPPSMALDFLLRRHVRPATRPRRSTMVTTTLDAMAAGGIYDHVGGGFARYSTDAALAGAALREDALRPGAARSGAYLHALAGHRRRPRYRRGRRGDHRLRAARPAPRGRRVLLRRGRRLRGRRGQVLRLVARPSSRRCAATTRPRSSATSA